MLLALLVVFVSGCMGEKKEIVPNEPGNISNYEFEVFLNESDVQVPANTTTYYLLENKTRVQVVNIVINTSKLEIYPPDTLGGSSEDNPIENFVLLVNPANETTASPQTFKELSTRNETSAINYTLTQEISRSMKVIHLEFKEPVTGFIAYTLETPATQSFAFLKPDSEFIRVVLPEGYVTGNRVFGIARPEPSDVTFDEKGRQTLLLDFFGDGSSRRGYSGEILYKIGTSIFLSRNYSPALRSWSCAFTLCQEQKRTRGC